MLMIQPFVTQGEIKNKLQHSLISLHKWCKGNGMVLNTSKTKVMLITTKQKRIHLDIDELSLNYENTKLNEISGDKILGVHVDNCLTFTDHIGNIAKKDYFKYMASFKNKTIPK